LPIVSVRIGVRRYRALVDTGAAVSMVAPEVSLRLGLQKVGNQEIIALSGERESFPLIELPHIGFADVDLAPCRAAVRPLTQLELRIELLLGVNAFAQHRLQFDFIEGRVYILP
jgi:predicted aspartyl protease